MKYLAIFSLLVVVSANSDIIREFRDAKTKCSTELKDTKLDFLGIITSKLIPSARNDKCYLSCIYQHFGIQNEEGKIIAAEANKAIDILKNKNKAMYNNLKEVFEKCSKEVEDEDDKCETASKFTSCGMKAGAQINMGTIMDLLKVL